MFSSNFFFVPNNELDPFSSPYTPQFHLNLENLESCIIKNPENYSGEIPVQEPSVPAAPKKRTSSRDRHSKIETARGPRDRRMRLSLDVAREFFGLQDMLGFDKASNTVEWLMKQSRSEIQNVKRGHTTVSSVESKSDLSNDGVSGPSKSDEKQPKGQKRRDERSGKCGTVVRNVVTKDLRVKARERAKERTREKMRRRVFGDSDEAGNCYVCSSFETSEESGTQSNNNIGLMSQQDDAIEDSLENLNRWSLDSILNHHHTDPSASTEHHDEDILSFLGKPWDGCNNENLF